MEELRNVRFASIKSNNVKQDKSKLQTILYTAILYSDTAIILRDYIGMYIN